MITTHAGALAALALLCPAIGAQSLVITAGLPDGFAAPTDSANTVTSLEGVLSPLFPHLDFDEFGPVYTVGAYQEVNRSLSHRFDNLPGNVVAATLSGRVRGVPGADCISDLVAIYFDDGTPIGSHLDSAWWRFFGHHNGSDGFLTGSQPWTNADDHPFSLDLANLPVVAGSTVNLLPMMRQLGHLDVVIGDETATDHLVLTLEVSGCVGANPPELPTPPSASTGFSVLCPIMQQSCSSPAVVLFGDCVPFAIPIPPPLGCGPCTLMVSPVWGSSPAPLTVPPVPSGVPPGFSFCVQCACIANGCFDLSAATEIVVDPT